jgi:hypothetical protein
MRPAPLPRGPGQDGGDGADQPGVVVAGHQLHAGQAAGGQAAQERQPPRAVLGAGHVDAEDFPVPVSVDTGGDQAVHIHGAAALADLLRQRADPAERVRPAVQQPVPEGLHQLVQLRRHRGHPRLGQAHDAGGDAQQVTGGHHRGQRPPGPAPVLQERRKYDPARSFGIASSIIPAPVSHSQRR